MSDDWMKNYPNHKAETYPHESTIIIKKYDQSDVVRISDIFANAALESVSRSSVSLPRPQIETSVHANGGMTKRVKFACHVEKASFEGRIQKDLLNVSKLKWCLSK